MAKRGLSTTERFEQHYIPEPNSGCWLWTGAVNKKGYGTFRVEAKTFFSHRISYELYKESIPIGLVIDHLCLTACCVNPEHLEPVTQAENTRRHWDRFDINTHCRGGHPHSQWNNPLRENGRVRCLTCERNQKKTQAQRKKSKGLAFRRNKDVIGWVPNSTPSKRGRNQFNS